MRKKRTLAAAVLAAALTLSFSWALAGQGNSFAQTVLTTEGTAPSANGLAAQKVQVLQATPTRAVVIKWLSGKLVTYRKTTWSREQLMGLPLTRVHRRRLSAMSVADLKQAVAMWRRRAHRVLVQFRNPPHKADWLCIHKHEAAWDNAGVNWRGNPSPYYGGLQMDRPFQRTYGAELLREKGTANHWTAYEQMWVAEKALRSGRGFRPWPNTARTCGLL